MKTLRELLIEFNAWEEVIEWAGDKTIEEFVKECRRGDFLLWLAGVLKIPKRKLIACAGHYANTVRNLMKDEKSIQLLDMCMNFEDKSISFKDLENDAAAEDAVCAAVCAAVDVAINPYRAYYAARDAVYAAIYFAIDAANAACDDARKQNQLQTANIVRERLGMDIINEVNKLLNN